ncbi:acyltransferase family protein [Microbacterium panaciterrae]
MSAEASRDFRSDIQGLRAIAVLLVLVFHAGVTALSGGFVGVDVFFVISGFLITSHLAGNLDAGTLRMREFWARRVRRLVPVAWIVAAATTLIALIVYATVNVPEMLKQAAATFAYVPNFLFAVEGTNYFGPAVPSPFQHYWSLGLEEQFYLVWPLILLGFYKLSRGNKRVLLILTAMLVVLSFVAGWWATSWRQPVAFFLLPTRAWELGIGAVLAIALPLIPAFGSDGKWKLYLGWGGLLGVLIAGFAYDKTTQFPGTAAALPALATAMLILAGTGTRGGVVKPLSVAPMQFLGKISYSVYLVHWPLVLLPQVAVGWENQLPLWVRLLLTALAVPLGWVCWRFMENPFRHASSWWGKRSRRALSVAVVGAVVLAAAPMAGATVVKATPLHADRHAAAPVLIRDPHGTAYVPSNMTPTLWTVGTDWNTTCHGVGLSEAPSSECLFGENDGAPRVALVGSSFAGSLFPALAQLATSNDLQVLRYTKDACQFTTQPVLHNGAANVSCDRWNREILGRLRANAPDVIFLANQPTESEAEDLRRALADLTQIAPVVVVEPVPDVGQDPIGCLSDHLTDAENCARNTVDALQGNVARQSAALAGAGFLEISPWICNPKTCPLIQGNVLVYKDSSHLTQTFAKLLAPLFKAKVDEVLHRG